MVKAREEVKGITVSTGEMEKRTEEQKESKEVTAQRKNRLGKSQMCRTINHQHNRPKSNSVNVQIRCYF